MKNSYFLEQNIRFTGEISQVAGRFMIRYGLVLIFIWIGAMKFTAFEAAQFSPLWKVAPL